MYCTARVRIDVLGKTVRLQRERDPGGGKAFVCSAETSARGLVLADLKARVRSQCGILLYMDCLDWTELHSIGRRYSTVYFVV